MTSVPSVIDMFPQEMIVSTQVKETNPGIQYSERWSEFIEIMMTFRNRLNAMGSDYSILRDYELQREVSRIRSMIINSLIKEHQNEISAAGGLIPHIGCVDVARETNNENDFKLDSNTAKSFSPIGVWKYLQEVYTLEKSTFMANQEVAKVITQKFRLIQQHSCIAAREPKAVAGMISFEMTCSLDSYSFGGKTEWSYGTHTEVKSLIINLAKFCDWADDYKTARDLSDFVKFNYNDRTVVSRQRFELGNALLITFNNKLEVRLSKDLAEKLRLYISKFAV